MFLSCVVITSCIHVSTILVLFISFPPCFCDFFSWAWVLISVLPCFIIIPYRYPVYFLDLYFLTWATSLAPSSDSGQGMALINSVRVFSSICVQSPYWVLKFDSTSLQSIISSFHYSFLRFYVFCHCCRINVIAPSLIPHLLLLIPSIYESIYGFCNRIAYRHFRCK